MSLNNDRLVFNKNREDNKINISLDLESQNSKKMEKEKVSGIYINYGNLCLCRG